jgi:hypothetical protein
VYNIRNKEISMRYLKKFFESFEENVLQDFCETHLAYLLDEGYELYIGDERGKKTISITIPSDVSDEDGEYDTGEFEWNNVKDHYITFLTHLNNKYNVVPYFDQNSFVAYDWFTRDEKDVVEFFTNSAGVKPGEEQYRHYYSVQEVLDDKPSELDSCLYEITVKVQL